MTKKKDVLYIHGLALRGIVRHTGLHHTTVRKAINRLKETFDILEVNGTRNSRLFCFTDSDNAEYIRSCLKIHNSEFDKIKKLNSKEVLEDNWDKLHCDTTIQRKIINKHRKQNPDNFSYDKEYGKIMIKRQSISQKNISVWKIRKNKSLKHSQ